MGKRIRSIGSSIKSGILKLSSPIRKTRVWKFLRRRILKSPFKGYFVSSWHEIKKVTWPNRKTAWKLTLTVIMFSVVFAVFTSVLDYGFEKLAKDIFLR